MFGYIYLTENILSSKRYIGQKRGSFNPKYLGSGTILKKAIQIYGKENFKVSLLDTAKDMDELNKLERHYISLYNATNDDKFYNIASGGDAWGSPHTVETRQKISLAAKGRVPPNKGKPNPSAAERMRNNNPMKDKTISQKVARKLRGRPSNNRVPCITLECAECRTSFLVKPKNRNRVFCGKSCAAAYINKIRWSEPEYKKRVGNAISRAKTSR